MAHQFVGRIQNRPLVVSERNKNIRQEQPI